MYTNLSGQRSRGAWRLAPIACSALGLLLTVVGCGKSKKEEPVAPSTQLAPPPEPQATPALVVDALTLPQLPDVPLPKDNPQTPEKVELGRQLFFDKRLSTDSSLSCYSCHQDEQGGGGKEPLAIGAKNKQLTRHSPVIWNVGHLSALYWDGRASTLEEQAKGAWAGGNMGVGKENLDKKAQEIAAFPEYQAAFKKVFPDQKVTADHVAQAISAFERTLECKDTAYDKYAKGDKSALTSSQKEGLDLFMGKGMCTACHSPPFFSSAYAKQGVFFNVGIGTKDVAEDQVDVGRMKVSEDQKDWAAFKIPSLRNVARSAPYFHDGSVATLKDAVRFMASGGYDNKNKNPLMSDKKLTDAELDSIVAFLGALDCEGKLQTAAK